MADTLAMPGGFATSDSYESRPTTSIPRGHDSGFTEQKDNMTAAKLNDLVDSEEMDKLENGCPSETTAQDSAGVHLHTGGSSEPEMNDAKPQQRSKKAVSIVLGKDDSNVDADWSVEIPGAVNHMEDSGSALTEDAGQLDTKAQRRWHTSGMKAKTTRLTIANARDGMHGQMTEEVVSAQGAESSQEATQVSGLHWRVVGHEEIMEGSGIANVSLAAALQDKMNDDALESGVGHRVALSSEELAGFSEPIAQLSLDHYIKVGELYFMPCAPEANRAEEGEKEGMVMFENEEEGTVIMKDEVKTQHKTLEELQAEDEKIAKKRRRGCCGIVFKPFEELPDLPLKNPCQMETENSIRRRCLNLAVDPSLNSFFVLTSVVHFLLALPEILLNVFMCDNISEISTETGAASAQLERACAATIPFFHHFLFLVSTTRNVLGPCCFHQHRSVLEVIQSTDSDILVGGVLVGGHHQNHRVWLLGKCHHSGHALYNPHQHSEHQHEGRILIFVTFRRAPNLHTGRMTCTTNLIS